MVEFQVNFPKAQIIFGFVYGIICIVLGSIFSSLSPLWYIFGAVMIGLSFYKQKYKYLSINDKEIQINTFFKKKKIQISEIESMEKKFGDFIILTSTNKYHIYKNSIDKNDWVQFEAYFENLKTNIQ